MTRSLAALSLLLWLAPGVAVAGDGTPMRVVVRVVSAADGQLLSRVDGQVADLEVTLLRHTSTSLAATIEQRFERARALARQYAARIVVWFDNAGPHGVRVYVAEPGRDTLFARRVVTADASARAEAVAIVVRTTLAALAQGGRIGVRVPRRTATPAPPRASPPPPALPGWRWNLGAQAQLSFDGESSPGQRGFMGRLDARRGRVQVGFVGTVGVSTELSDSMTIVSLARHSAGIGGALLALETPRSALWLGVDVGLIAYARSTTVAGGALTPTAPNTTWAGFAAPVVRGQWRPLATRGLWFTVELAAAVVAGAPELRYELDGAPVTRNELWPIQPSVAVGLRLESM